MNEQLGKDSRPEGFHDIGITFIDQIDQYVRDHMTELLCTDISSFYYKFTERLKLQRSTAAGFTGLSEFLLFSCVRHYLSPEFKPKKKPNGILWEFVNDRIHLGQSLPIPLETGQNKYPDISIRNDRRMTAIQIKIYLTNNLKTLESEWDGLERLQEGNRDFRGALIIYWLGEKSRCNRWLKEKEEQNAWFRYEILSAPRNGSERIIAMLERLVGAPNSY